ncbi:uncharacterized protein LOC119669506 isoform X2 [Teleopsis dalmanni]|uniref:uncharacterized protein LOC119669506 isoform X2 n=1 Tax=Teleopsis dalmanni TaxID=139649 RepID=UPI0018CE713A|nr:uncharacterized protein LOC119669506 isoform X2 [Teleopsis dalmanni]
MLQSGIIVVEKPPSIATQQQKQKPNHEIQYVEYYEPTDPPLQHHHAIVLDNNFALPHNQSTQNNHQRITQMLQLSEQPNAATTSNIIVPTADFASNQIFKIVSTDGAGGIESRQMFIDASTNSKMLLGNITMLPKQVGNATNANNISVLPTPQNNQQPQTINFVGTKNIPYISGGNTAQLNGKKFPTKNANVKNQIQTTGTFVQQTPQHVVHKVNVPTKVISRMPTIVQQATNNTNHNITQQPSTNHPYVVSQSHKYVTASSSNIPKIGNIIKKNVNKSCQNKISANNTQQQGTVKTFIAQQAYQYHPNNNNKITKTKLLKQLGNTTGGGVSIATLPLQQSFGTYTINSNKLNSSNQNNATTKVTKMTNNKFIMQNQPQHVATLPQGTQLQHKTMQATQPQSNIVVQQQILPNSIVGGNSNSSASNSNIKYVNSQGAVIQQHQTHPSSQHSQKYRQQFLETPVCIQRENNTVTNNASSAISNYQTELDMTDEMSARILQSMAQKHFNKQQAQHHQQKLKVLPSQSQPHYIIQNSPGSTNIVLSPNDFSTYNSQQQNSYMPISAKTLITNVASNSAPSISLSNANAEKNHSTSVNRSQSLERKQLDTNSAKRATEFIKNSNASSPVYRNNNNFNGLSVGALPTTESVAFIQSIKQNTDTTLISTNSYSANTTANLSQDDDIIGEEVRPLPITDDVKLHCLHAVWLDHTYANAAPTRLTTEAVNNNANSSTLHKTVSNSGHIEAQPSSSLVANPVSNNWTLGGISATSANNAPSDITVITVPNSLTSTSSGTPSVYSLYGQQITRQPQDDDAHSAISNGSRVATGDIDPGEETETAPEAEAEDDSLTRCICDLTHDDGYMICCDKCSAWQHVDCMGIERHNIPEEYLCEICQPRPVDKVRARQIQLMIRKEQALSMQSGVSTLVDAAGVIAASKMHFNENINRPGANISQKDTLQNSKNSGVLKKGKVLKKTKETGVKKLKREKNGEVFSSGKNIRKETKKNTKRKSKTTENSAHPVKQSNHMSNLIEHYEHAMTNHYSQQLRARIYSLTKVPSIMQAINMKSNELLKDYRNFESKATIVPFAGGKILISNQDIKSNSPIVELLGKCMLQEQFISQNSHAYINDPPVTTNPLNKVHKTPGPFVFFYHLPNVEDHTIEGSTLTQLQGQKICIDCRTYGNEARFVRRSCRPNAKVQHIVEKNAVHLFIVATTDIRASTEITITHEPHDLLALETPKSSNISVISTSTPCACTCFVCPFVNTTSKTNRRNRNSPVSSVSVVTTNTTMGSSKKKQLNNRNRSTSSSTSSSGDSTIGLNSPNIINNLYKNNMIGNNPRAANSNSKNVFPMVGTPKNSNGNLLSVRNNLNDSSPFITISPIQQQQQKLPVLQNSVIDATLTEPTLVIQTNQQIMSSLPSSMIVSPHQIQLPQQPQVLPVVQQVSLTVAVAPETVTASATPTNTCIVASSNFEEEKVEKPMIAQLQTPVSPILLQTSPKHQDIAVELPLLPQQQPVQTVVNSNDATIDDTLAASALQTLNSANKSSTEIEQNISSQVVQTEKDEVDIANPQQHVSLSINNNITIQNVPVQESASHKPIPTTSNSLVDTGRKINTRNSRLTSCSDDISNDCQLGTEEGSSNINTVVTSTPNVGQKLSREDRKMQAIIRAIENMERKQKKQSKSAASKRRGSNNNNGNSSSEIELLNSKKSSLTTRKKKRKPYKSHPVNGAQRKRRKSRINSNESDADHDADAENDTIPMSECESTSMLSPPIQTTASNTASSGDINTPALITSALANTDTFINESTNVDQAAGLLMAFANPNKITNLDSLNYPIENHLPETQKVFPNINVSTERYLINNEFKSPQRLSLPVENVMSPPSTPPTQISSACLLIEAAVGPLESLDSGSNTQCDDGFKYPAASRTKKAITDWTHQDAQSSSHNCNLTNASGITMASTHAGVLGLDSLVQAAMSDFAPQQNYTDKISDESQNVSIAAKKIEEFINQTEGSSSPLITLEEQYTGLTTHSVPNKHYNALAELNVDSAERHLQLPLQVSTCNNSSVKKRWLRQAISEETDESALTPSPVTPSTTSPTSQINTTFPVNNGFSTPLKKRRLVLRNKDDDLNETLNLNQTSQFEGTNEEGSSDLNKSDIYATGNNSPLRTEEVDVVGNIKTEDEAEIVDVGTDIILPVNHNHDLKQENDEDIKPILSIESEKKSEIILDQDDDVDILRSPSPGQKIVAEDNLVKIEPEDTNCCDDVKIDVEREESMTGDKFKEFVDIKTEENKNETVKIKDDINIIDNTLENNDIKREIDVVNSSNMLKNEKEMQLQLFVDDQKTVLQESGSIIKKIEQQIPSGDQTTKRNSTEIMPTSNEAKKESITYTSISKRERKDLSDDDIKERLHSFHKENILFLQSRNKKSKSESSTVSTEIKSKHEKRRNEKSTSSETSVTKKSHHSSASKKSHKKERSRSCSSSATSKMNVQNVRSENSSTTHTATANKADTETIDIVGINSSSLSNKKTKSLANTTHANTTSIEKERNRHRSFSSSSSGNLNTKKRQLNFDQELNKDIATICTKIRKDNKEDSGANSTKKRRLSNSLLNEREDNRNCINNSNIKIIKSQSASSVISSNTKILDKIYEASIKDKTSTIASVSNILPATTTTTPTNAITAGVSHIKQPTQQQYRSLTQQTLDEGCQAPAPIVNEHISLPTFNNIVLTGSSFNNYVGGTSTPATTTIPPNNTMPLSQVSTNIALPIIESAITVAGNQSQALNGKSNISTYAPANHNSIYGKLQDNVNQQHSNLTSTQTTPSNSALLSLPTTIHADSHVALIDTNVRSFSTLGNYQQQHSTLCTLDTGKYSSDGVSNSTITTEKTTLAAINANTSNKFCTPLKQVSKDPRLNPTLNTPDPPPVPKRKLSILEYRKRMKLSTSESSTSGSMPSTPITPETPSGTNTVSNNLLTTGLSFKTSTDTELNASVERVDLDITTNMQKSCNMNSKDDVLRGQFSAEPTLLEKQQEKYLEARQFNESEISLLDKTKLHFSLSNTSNLDNCLDPISSSSSSNSVSSSRESSP